MKRQEEAEAKKEEGGGGGGWLGWATGWGTSSTEEEKGEEVAVAMPTGLYRANAPCVHVGTSCYNYISCVHVGTSCYVTNHCKKNREMSEKLKSQGYDSVLHAH